MATTVPRTQLHTSDLSPDDFGILAGKVVSKTGLAGPFELTEGTIADYENQSGKPEIVWFGGSEEQPACVWVVFADDSSIKIKWPSPSEEGFCQAVVDCTIADLAKGGGTDDKYLVPELAGPTWQLLSVIYGEDDTEVDFSDVIEDDLIALVGALNDHDDLPDGWLWSISSSVLVLSVPHDTGVTQISIAGGFEIDFTAPSVIGTPASQLAEPMAEALAGPMDVVIAQYEAMLETYAGVLANTFGVGVGDTTAEIETEFTANAKIEVRWTDALGRGRVSYKDPVNGWHHPVPQPFISVAPVTLSSIVSPSTVNTTIDVSSVITIPEGAYAVQLRALATLGSGATGTDSVTAKAWAIGKGAEATPNLSATILGAPGTEIDSCAVEMDADNEVGIYFTSNDETGAAALIVTGFYCK